MARIWRPEVLARRLRQIGVVERARGGKLQSQLALGQIALEDDQCLVTPVQPAVTDEQLVQNIELANVPQRMMHGSTW